MNALNRWKIVLTLIATFVAGAATGMFLTVRATNYETEWNELRPGAPFALDGSGAQACVSRRTRTRRLRPIVWQADDELRNLYALNLRETNGILDCAQDRMSPSLQLDQRAKLQKTY
jgi:hypothetical protein